MSLRTVPASVFAHALRIVATTLVLAVALGPPATADWLVTHDGARFETKGPWTVEGNRVVFTLPNGTLSVMRKSEVDLEASDRASSAAKAPPPAPAPRPAEEPKKPVMVLTNKNVSAAAAAPERAAEDEAPAAAPVRPPGSAKVDVISWESRDSREVDGLEVVGTLRNTGVEIATNINVAVTVIDQENQPLYETTAFLRSSGLAPGRSTTFRALLPGIYTLFKDPVFDVQAGAITVQGAPAPGEKSDFAAGNDDGGDASDGNGGEFGTGDAFEDRPPGVIEGVDSGDAYEETTLQAPQGEGGGS